MHTFELFSLQNKDSTRIFIEKQNSAGDSSDVPGFFASRLGGKLSFHDL